MKIINFSLLVALLSMAAVTDTKMVEYAENTYAMQAPVELIALADKTAERIGFESAYEVAVPKKAGLVGWQRFIIGGTTATQNAFVLVNPAWFNQIPEEQQIFLIARAMLFHTHGTTSPYATYITIMTVIFSILCLILFFWLLVKTPLGAYNRILCWILAAALNIAVQKIMVAPLVTKLSTYAGLRHDIFISKLAAEKLGDTESALKALEFYDASIKEAVKNGEALFKPFENTFENIAAGLKE